MVLVDNGQSPAHMSAWCKQRMGWLPVNQLQSDVLSCPIDQVETNQVLFQARECFDAQYANTFW